MNITNVNINDQNEQVRWNNENSIAWLRFEKQHPNTIFYKLCYDKNEEFQKIEVNSKKSNLRSSSVAASPTYALPKAYSSRLPVSNAKLKDLLQLCGEKTIPPSHHKFYEELVSLGVDKVEDGDTLCSEVTVKMKMIDCDWRSM